MKIYLVRHTAVDVPPGTCYGQTDVPLKASFEQEAQAVANRLREMKIDPTEPNAVFSSPLSRCKLLAHYCGFGTAILDNRLKELNFGRWEQQRWDDLDMAEWRADWINNPAPEGESFTQMYERVASFLDELKTCTANKALIFTHGGVINCARVHFGQADISRAFDNMPGYGEIMVLIVNC
jgi:alpha-ribazole phosphatase